MAFILMQLISIFNIASHFVSGFLFWTAPRKRFVNWLHLADPIVEATVYNAYLIIHFISELFYLCRVQMNGLAVDFRSVRMSSYLGLPDMHFLSQLVKLLAAK